jgi:hypothetical protein
MQSAASMLESIRYRYQHNLTRIEIFPSLTFFCLASYRNGKLDLLEQRKLVRLTSACLHNFLHSFI